MTSTETGACKTWYDDLSFPAYTFAWSLGVGLGCGYCHSLAYSGANCTGAISEVSIPLRPAAARSSNVLDSLTTRSIDVSPCAGRHAVCISNA